MKMMMEDRHRYGVQLHIGDELIIAKVNSKVNYFDKWGACQISP